MKPNLFRSLFTVVFIIFVIGMAPQALAGEVVMNIVDKETSDPLCYKSAWAVLYRVTDYSREYVQSKSLPYTEECWDSGGELIFADDERTIPDGAYQVDVSAYNYLLERVSFTVEGGFADLGTVALTPSPVWISLVTMPETIPSAGGFVRFAWMVYNFSDESEGLQTYAEVCGEGTTTSYTCVDASPLRAAHLGGGEKSRKFVGRFLAEADQPDGWYSICIYVFRAGHAWEQVGSSCTSIKKGLLPPSRG